MRHPKSSIGEAGNPTESFRPREFFARAADAKQQVLVFFN
jgi:hypothetical protein